MQWLQQLILSAGQSLGEVHATAGRTLREVQDQQRQFDALLAGGRSGHADTQHLLTQGFRTAISTGERTFDFVRQVFEGFQQQLEGLGQGVSELLAARQRAPDELMLEGPPESPSPLPPELAAVLAELPATTQVAQHERRTLLEAIQAVLARQEELRQRLEQGALTPVAGSPGLPGERAGASGPAPEPPQIWPELPQTLEALRVELRQGLAQGGATLQAGLAALHAELAATPGPAHGTPPGVAELLRDLDAIREERQLLRREREAFQRERDAFRQERQAALQAL